MLLHHFEQVDRSYYIVFVIKHREIIALPNGLLRGEVHYTIDRFFLLLVPLEKVV